MKVFGSDLRFGSSSRLAIDCSPQTIELAPNDRSLLWRSLCGTGTGVPDRRLAWRGGGTLACAEVSS